MIDDWKEIQMKATPGEAQRSNAVDMGQYITHPSRNLGSISKTGDE